ncbi:MAG: hypothetical protein IJO38_03025 [Akkermansia sp.]|nr:hypothetical protein [Akkermansia sp.]
MKKFFASLLALVGMVAGLALTSCGGGGGQTNLDNTNIIVSGGGISYQISFGSKLEGTGLYDGYIGEVTGLKGVRVLISPSVNVKKTDTETGLPSDMSCTMSMAEWENESAAVFAAILSGGYKSNVNGFSANNLTFTLKEDGGAYSLTWSWTGEASYTTPNENGNGSITHEIVGDGAGNEIVHTGVAVTRG